MDLFKQKIKSILVSKWIDFPGIDDDTIVAKTLASAEEYVLSKIAVDLLSKDDRDLFRDAYLSAPDIFDADEFLSERVENYDKQVDLYFEQWLDSFKNSL